MTSLVPSSKSQPLHNFSLPHLKWKNHRSGRSILAGETSSSSSPPHRSPSTPWRESPSPSIISRRPSPLHKSESESEQTLTVNPIENSTNSTKTTKLAKSNRSNKICIRLRTSPVHDDTPPSAAEEEESAPKTWNLRPRRPPISNKQFNGGFPKIGSSSPLPENKTCYGSNLNREAFETKNNDLLTSHKQKFSIALSRDEIEEDIFSLTGSKPSRRPKKRPRTVQKQLDTLFPGLWLGSITADSYKVSEAPP